VAVVGHPIAVQRNTNLYAALGEQLTELPGQPDPVGVDAQIETALARQGRAERADDRAHPAGRHEQRLAPVEDERPRTVPPALVWPLVDVAVITGEITPAVDIEYELPDRNQRIAQRPNLDGWTESGDRHRLDNWFRNTAANYCIKGGSICGDNVRQSFILGADQPGNHDFRCRPRYLDFLPLGFLDWFREIKRAAIAADSDP
jgi:hypothetical protein